MTFDPSDYRYSVRVAEWKKSCKHIRHTFADVISSYKFGCAQHYHGKNEETTATANYVKKNKPWPYSTLCAFLLVDMLLMIFLHCLHVRQK